MGSDREILRMLGATGNSFLGRFRSLTEVQRQSIPPILSGKDVLVASATASGKTEAIVAPMVARLHGLKPSREKSGVKILVVAPTRALVNDLFNRLQSSLSETGWQCGRQTSDHSDKGRKPHMLITTPESFDSMLCHDATTKHGEIVGHLLATVKAVFLDEAHLYEDTARGDHVAWLVARLRRLKKFAFQKGWILDQDIHVCAGSATVSQASSLAGRLLGPSAVVIRVGGDREMELYSLGPPSKWVPIRSSDGLAPIRDLMQSFETSEENPVNIVWGAIQNAAQDGLRKLLMFVPSRQQCDLLSAQLRTFFESRRNIYVGGHHGSLDKTQREEAEKMFAFCRDALLVATSTLEVGVDIGDVDVIVLLGAPPDTSALLQRIGRGGRRSGLIKIIPIPRHKVDSIAFSSMVLYASQGILEAAPASKRWGVFVQQAISLIMQSRGRGRKPSDLLELAEAVWGTTAVSTAQAVIQHLLTEELLVQQRGRLFLGEKFSDGVNQSRAYYHCNFESGGPTTAVVDHLTHRTIGHVASEGVAKKGLAIGGSTVDVVHGGEQILVKKQKGDAVGAFPYNARMPLVSKSYAEHVRRGLGFGENETIVYDSQELGPVWFHFGGGLYERILRQVLKGRIRGSLVLGLALKGDIGEGDIWDLSSDELTVRDAVDGMKLRVANNVGAGRFHAYLPDHVQAEVIASIFDIDGFLRWAASRIVTPAPAGSPQWHKIGTIL